MLVYGASVPSGESFTLTATTPAFSLTSVSPSQGSNAGQVTITIDGAQFNASSQPELIDSAGTTMQPVNAYYGNPGQISATFDLAGTPAGAATVEVVNSGGATQTLPGSFRVISGTPGQLVTSLVTSSSVRVGRVYTIDVDYTNSGDTDLLAPVLYLQDLAGDSLSFSSDMSDASSELDLVAVADTGPAGILAPGESGQIVVYGTGSVPGPDSLQLSAAQYPTTPIDWAALESTLEPAGDTTAQWDPIFKRLQTDVGSSWADYQQTIADDATLLSPAEGLNYSLSDVYQFEVGEAEALVGPAVTGTLFLDNTSNPLPNVTIHLEDPTKSIATYAVSNTDGSFAIPQAQPGTYQRDSRRLSHVGAGRGGCGWGKRRATDCISGRHHLRDRLHRGWCPGR